MQFGNEIESFIKDFVDDLREENVAIFAGAGMSRTCGYVDWRELLRDIATDLELDVRLEHDLISLAQFHVNKKKGADKLARKILEEFSHDAEPSETHEILAQLPIRTYWTTNYDTLIEDALRKAFRIPDVKHKDSQLNNTRPKRDAVVYKMHGDISDPGEAVLYKQQYERYHREHEAFVTALSGDLISKTFLFIGFSFTDPNLDYVLSRLHLTTAGKGRTHYCFMRDVKKTADIDDDDYNYQKRKQKLRIEDLQRFKIETLVVSEYEDIPRILNEIRARFLKKTVFISGSAEEFGEWPRDQATGFVHELAAALVGKGYRIVNGFGWGIGSAVINGALDMVYRHPEKHSEDQLIVRPFPQFATKKQNLKVLWEEYRQRMIALSGVSIFIFGNKKDEEGKVISANGVVREFEIAHGNGAVPIPVAATGYASKEIYDQISPNPELYYPGRLDVWDKVSRMADDEFRREDLVSHLISTLDLINK